jgi:signal transduction histidine kinase
MQARIRIATIRMTLEARKGGSPAIMKSSWVFSHNREFDPGSAANIAIVVAVVVTFITAAVTQDPALTLPVWIILFALGALHLFLYFPPKEFFFCEQKPARMAAYFLLQLLICGTMQYLGNGHFWLLFLPLSSQASFVFTRKAMAVFSVLVIVLFLLPIETGNLAGTIQYGLIFVSAQVFVLIFSEVAVRERTISREKDKIARELEEANARLREAAVQAEELIRSRERNRMAREIHDSLGHYLTVVNVQLEAAKALVEDRGWKDSAPELFAALDKAQALTRNGLEDVRRSVAALRASATADRPLRDALQSLAEESREAGLLVGLAVDGDARNLPPQHELTLFRAAQEGLTNVRKHARASRADLRLHFAANSVRLDVIDNGVGVAECGGESESRFGLLGLRERAELLHGRFDIVDAEGGGTRLTVELPT